MTEQEWLQCTDPQKMLEFLRGKTSDRKLRLFICALARQLWSQLRNERTQQVVVVAERFADGMAQKRELTAAGKAVQKISQRRRTIDETHCALAIARCCAYANLEVWLAWENPIDISLAAGLNGKQQQILLRCIFGNPFRPVALSPAWLTWNDGTVQKIAQGIYEERGFDRMPILADALEEAGCQDQDILTHCRQPGQHVRGCWVVDLLMGKECLRDRGA